MSGLGLGLGLGLGAHRIVDRYGNMPATFTIAAESVDAGVKRINFSEPVTLTLTGDVTLSIGGTPYYSGATIPVATGSHHVLTINNPGAAAGTITFGKRKQITYLNFEGIGSFVITGDITGMNLTYLRFLVLAPSSAITGDITGMTLTGLLLYNLGSSVITGDITGMKLTTLNLSNIGSSTITGDITGMKLTRLHLYSLGSSVITGDITGMELTLTYLRLFNIGSSVITGDITGMELIYIRLVGNGLSVITGDITGMELEDLYLNNVGSSLTYGTNPLNFASASGIQLLNNTVFSASEYIQLFADAATCVTDGKWTAATKIMTISGGENPGWSNVSAYYATIVGGGVTVTVPLAWETGDDPFPSEKPNP